METVNELDGSRPLRFGPSYSERLDLGRPVFFRALKPDDGQHLLEGFSRLSPESRYSRFMGLRKRLSETDLRYLCETDGYDHVALCAWVETPRGTEGVAVARFARLPSEPGTAEPAITVIDDYQGRGIGTALLDRLASAALERGITRFRCEFLPQNRRIRRMLSRLGTCVSLREDSLAVTMEIELHAGALSPRVP